MAGRPWDLIIRCQLRLDVNEIFKGEHIEQNIGPRVGLSLVECEYWLRSNREVEESRKARRVKDTECF